VLGCGCRLAPAQTAVAPVLLQPGQTLRLEARADVAVSGRLVLRRGAPAEAKVTLASQHMLRGQGGRLGFDLQTVTLADGQPLALGSGYDASGGGVLGKKGYTAAVVASVMLLSPAGMAFLLIDHGYEVVLPEGTAVEGYVSQATPLDAARFAAADAAPVVGPVEVMAPQGVPLPPTHEALLIETSAGDGSVWIDSRYRGEAPLTVDLHRGMHTVRIDHDGYKEWKQRVLVEGDHLKMKATLVAR
jgi:hypothetical protein